MIDSKQEKILVLPDFELLKTFSSLALYCRVNTVTSQVATNSLNTEKSGMNHLGSTCVDSRSHHIGIRNFGPLTPSASPYSINKTTATLKITPVTVPSNEAPLLVGEAIPGLTPGDTVSPTTVGAACTKTVGAADKVGAGVVGLAEGKGDG